VHEIQKLLGELGITVNVTAPLNASVADMQRLGEADFNVVLYPEIAGVDASWLTRTFGQPVTKVIPIGVNATTEFIAENDRLKATIQTLKRQNGLLAESEKELAKKSNANQKVIKMFPILS
jgi:nitrogenase molybdenum-iron protein alpha/beta subunit